MKKLTLIILACIVSFVFYFFFFERVEAQDKSDLTKVKQNSSESFGLDWQLFPSKEGEKIKDVPRAVKNAKSIGMVFEKRELFQSTVQRAAEDSQLNKVLSDGTILDLNKQATQKILKENVEFLTLPLPDANGATVELELVKVNIFAPGFTVKTSTAAAPDESFGVHYRGIVKGNDRSLVAISIFKNEVMGFYSTEADGNRVLGRLGGENAEDKHVLYADRNLKNVPDFYCDTEDSGKVLPDSLLREPEQIAARCVKIYIEANYDLFLNKGSAANVTSYLTGMFNQSAALFSNDGIPVSISQIFVWTSPSPYTGADSQQQLQQFRATRTSFNGDLAHLITLQSQFGGRAYVDVLCNSSSRYAFSGIFPTLSNVPTYSWTVGVFTHETGHNLGSSHTHACVWNGNGTAIDGCFTPEGSCPQPGLPAGGGTIMSYCHNASVGINFNFGFGPQPRNVIVNRFNSAACLADCGGTGGCTSTPISFGQTINGSLASGDCINNNRYYDAYTFSGTAGQQIAISMNGSSLDTYLYLLNSSGTVIAENDDGGGGTNSRIPATSGFFTLPATGTYTIRASSYYDTATTGGTGTYTLSLSQNGGNSCTTSPISAG